MSNLDRHMSFSAGWVAGPAFGAAMMAAPEYFHLEEVWAGLVFWAGLIIFALTLTIVAVKIFREKGGHASDLVYSDFNIICCRNIIGR